MKHTWKVSFEAKFTGMGEWFDSYDFVVVANGDGGKAVEKARKFMMKYSFQDGDGTKRQCVQARFIGLQRLDEING